MGTRRQLCVGNECIAPTASTNVAATAANRLRMHMPLVWGRCRPNAIIR